MAAPRAREWVLPVPNAGRPIAGCVDPDVGPASRVLADEVLVPDSTGMTDATLDGAHSGHMSGHFWNSSRSCWGSVRGPHMVRHTWVGVWHIPFSADAYSRSTPNPRLKTVDIILFFLSGLHLPPPQGEVCRPRFLIPV